MKFKPEISNLFVDEPLAQYIKSTLEEGLTKIFSVNPNAQVIMDESTKQETPLAKITMNDMVADEGEWWPDFVEDVRKEWEKETGK